MSPVILIRRLGGGVLVLWLVSVTAFLLVALLPGDAAESIAGESATAADVEVIRERLGLDKPLPLQYVDWLVGVLTGDFGTSLRSGESVTGLILQAAPATFSLAALAIVIATLIALPAGTIAALRQGGWTDRIISTFATVGIAMPSFWILMLLIIVFAQLNPWLPATGYEPLSSGLWTWLSHLLLPATALGLAVAAEMARHTRGCVVDVLSRPYIRTARARGAGGWWLVRRHVVRNAAIPVVTVLGLQIGHLVGGAIVVEAVAGIPGLGTMAIEAIFQREYPTIQGFVLLTGAIIVIANLAVDVAYTAINPRVRIEA
jgi:peptide/nickel transport system permease protein